MSLTDQFQTNAEVEVAGVPVTYGRNKDGSVPTFVIARAGKSNKRYQTALNAAFRPYQRAHQLGTLDAEVADEVYRDVFVKNLLKGWSNVNLSDVTGNKEDEGFAAFNTENALRLFKRLPELYDDLADKAGSAALYREALRDEDAGN